MKAELYARERIPLSDTSFAQIVIWRVPVPVRGSDHPYKYSLSLVSDGVCILRYDNEAGKGDHKHTTDGKEEKYRFVDLDSLRSDFFSDVRKWREKRWGL
jgi:hypothetical protein